MQTAECNRITNKQIREWAAAYLVLDRSSHDFEPRTSASDSGNVNTEAA